MADLTSTGIVGMHGNALTLADLISDAQKTAAQDHANAYDENGDDLRDIGSDLYDQYLETCEEDKYKPAHAMQCAAAYAATYTDIIREGRASKRFQCPACNGQKIVEVSPRVFDTCPTCDGQGTTADDLND